MGALLIKIYQTTLEIIGRVLLFNRRMPTGFIKTSDVVFSSLGKMDIFSPANRRDLLPVVIYLHGGGWTTGSKLTSTRLCATFASEGFLVLNIKYRLGPKYRHPDQLEDIGNVLKWLNKNKGSYKADINKIFFGGSSAGAHLSCMSACIATNEKLRKSIGVDFPVKSEQVAGSLLIYGGYNMESIINSGFFMIKTMVKSYIGTNNPSEYKLKDQISPVHHISKEFPPSFITAGERDPLYGQTVELIEVLKKKGRSYTELLFDRNVKNAKHAFVNFNYRDCSKKAYEGMINFLKSNS